jgi:hypothetical protein
MHANPKDAETALFEMISDAYYFFESLGYTGRCGEQAAKIETVDTPVGRDINFNGIEVGSYGIREFEGFKWVYGTGAAEPRLSQAIGRKL